ncbi:MAG: hypothetical protein NC102_01945 [Clostridium sp.]|nr:hypothetical protein [Clostridium sp.]
MVRFRLRGGGVPQNDGKPRRYKVTEKYASKQIKREKKIFFEENLENRTKAHNFADEITNGTMAEW